MMCRFRYPISIVLVFTLACLFLVCPSFAAEDHVLKASELQNAILNASRARETNLTKVRGFFSSERASKALKGVHMDPLKIEEAVSQLSDEELERLASRTEQMQRDFAAGSLTNQQLTYIVIALGTAVLILVLVAAR